MPYSRGPDANSQECMRIGVWGTRLRLYRTRTELRFVTEKQKRHFEATDPYKRQIHYATIYGSGQAADNNTDPDKRQVFLDATIYGSGQAAGIFGFHNIRIRTSGR